MPFCLTGCNKSTPPSGTGSGPSGSDGGSCADGSSPPCPCNATISIGRVIRGNPYVPRNASTADGMPDSVPPSKTYEVEVTVANWTGECAGKHFDLTIANTSGDNGDATVSPTQVSGNGTFKVTVKGSTQTKRDHGGQLKIQAKLDGAVKSESAGFTVCAHPINFRDTLHSDINTRGAVGLRVQDDWDSDSGTFTDLNQVDVSEVVEIGAVTSPPYAPLDAAPQHTSEYLPADEKSVDSHSEPRPTAGPEAQLEKKQLSIFKCKRCGATDKVQPNSGFKIIHNVFKEGTQWKHRTKKIGAPVTIGAYTAQAGTANNVKSPDHLLP